MNSEALSLQTDAEQLISDFQGLRDDAERIENELQRIEICCEVIKRESNEFCHMLDELGKSSEEQVEIDSVFVEFENIQKESRNIVNVKENCIFLLERFRFELKRVSLHLEMFFPKLKNAIVELCQLEKSSDGQIQMENGFLEFEQIPKESSDIVNVREVFVKLLERFVSELERVSIWSEMFELKCKSFLEL